MTILKPLFLSSFLCLAACGSNQAGTSQPSNASSSGSHATSPLTGTDANSNTANANTTNANTSATNANVANANDSNSLGASGSGNANVTGTMNGNNYVPQSAVYGFSNNSAIVVLSDDPQECNSLTIGSVLAGSISVEIEMPDFASQILAPGGNPNEPISSTGTAQGVKGATASVAFFDKSCQNVDLPGDFGDLGVGGNIAVISGGTTRHDDLQATFSLEMSAGDKLSGSVKAVYCDALSQRGLAGLKTVPCH